MQDHPSPPSRPSAIEENPTLLIGLLFVVAAFLLAAVAKFVWHIYDRQLVEWILWLLLLGVVIYFAVYQTTRAKIDRENAWPKQLPTIPSRGEKELVERA